jgi:hypothetical protein
VEVLVREDAESLVVQVETLALSTTFGFYSRAGVLLTRADHFVNMELGHLEMSMSWIIMHEAPRGQWHPMRWRVVQRRRERLIPLTVGIMSVPL